MDLWWQIPAAVLGLPGGYFLNRQLFMWGLHVKEDPAPVVKESPKPVNPAFRNALNEIHERVNNILKIYHQDAYGPDGRELHRLVDVYEKAVLAGNFHEENYQLELAIQGYAEQGPAYYKDAPWNKSKTREVTVEEVFNGLTEEQKQVVYLLIGEALDETVTGDYLIDQDDAIDIKKMVKELQRDHLNDQKERDRLVAEQKQLEDRLKNMIDTNEAYLKGVLEVMTKY